MKTELARTNRVNATYSLLDQVVVSGCRFAISLLIIRAAGAAALGTYGLVMSVVFLVLATQQTLITTPFANFRHRTKLVTPRQYHGTIWLASVFLALLAGVMVALVGVLFWSLAGGTNGQGSEAYALATGFLSASIAVPVLLQVEFFRRIWLIKLQSKYALILDAAVWFTAITILFIAMMLNQLTLSFVFAVLANVSLVATLACIASNVRYEKTSLPKTKSLGTTHWSFGKWILFSEGSTLGKSSLTLWIIGGLLGLEATGVFEACRSLMRAVNPYFLAVTNVAEPTLAKGFAEAGRKEVGRIAYKVLLIMLIGTLPICLAIAIGSKFLLELLFSSAVAAYWPVVVLLATSGLLFSISYPFANSLQAIDKPHINFGSRLVSFAIAVFGSLIAAPIYGIVGVAACIMAGSLGSLCCRLFFFHKYFADKSLDEPNESGISSTTEFLSEIPK